MLKAYLFGPMRIMQDGEPLALPVSVPARSLLAYLLLDKETPHSRLVLAGNLWPEMEEVRARRRLSQALWSLRNALPGLVKSDRQTISVDADTVWVDAHAFQELVKTDSSLHQAVALYSGELLAGFYEDWIITRREHIRETYLQSLEHLISLEKAAGRFEEALAYGQRLVAMDPLQESIHRELMRLYMALDRPKSALKQFETCRQVLRTELGAEPNPASVQLAEEIARRALLESPADLPQPETSAPTGGELASQTIPLIGRDGERRTLLAHIDRMLDGQGGLILVEGEAGVGKTRLLQEIAVDADWRGIQSLWGYGREMEVTPPFGPLVAALESGLTHLRVEQLSQTVEKTWLQVLTALLPALASHLPELPPPSPIAPNQERPRLLEAISQFLIAWARITPLIIILENLHWIDRDTLDILPSLVRRIGPAGILLIATYRSEEARAYPVLWEKLQAIDRAGRRDRMILPRLDAPATGELIRHWLNSRGGAPIFETRLYQETEGNPLFVLETLRALQDEGLLQRDESGQWSTPWDETTNDYTELPVPAVVEDVIDRRISRLQPVEREVLTLAAILGSTFDYPTLRAVMELETPAALSHLRNLIHRQLIEETRTGYQFTHDKILQVAYEKNAPEIRVRYHRQVGQAIEKTDPKKVTELARHFFRGELWEQAVHYKQQAGDQAEAVYAHHEAIKHYTDGLRACEQIPQGDPACRIKLLFGRESANGLLGNRDAQREGLSILEKVVQTDIDQATLALHWARFHETISDYPAMHRSAQKAIQSAQRSGEKKLEIEAQIEVARSKWLQGNYPEAQNQLENVIQNAHQSGDIHQEAIARFTLGHLYFEQNKYLEALAYYENVLPLFEKLDDRYYLSLCFNSLGNVYESLGNQPLAIGFYENSLEIRKELGDKRGSAMVQYNLSLHYHHIGDVVAATQHIREMITKAQVLGDRRLAAYGLTYLGLLIEKSDPKLASQQYGKALEIRREIGQWPLTMDCLAGLARVARLQGDHSKAQDYIHEALSWIAENGPQGVGDVLLVYQSAFEIYSGAGVLDKAEKVLETAHQFLWERLESMPDDASRRQFLENIPENRMIYCAYQIYLAQQNGHQIPTHLPKADAPTGRPLREDEWVEIVWTAYAPEDAAIQDKTERRRHCLQRLLYEARSQGAAPTLTDLAAALNVSTATIKRDLAALREAGILVHTRGSRRK
ncbi:MAG: AAA family ATPase [Chloroflexota bacterium]